MMIQTVQDLSRSKWNHLNNQPTFEVVIGFETLRNHCKADDRIAMKAVCHLEKTRGGFMTVK
jgi:hypothetical protein